MTVEELIKRYEIIRKGENLCIRNVNRAKKENAISELKERKSEIMDKLIEKERAYEDRKRKISEIEGLKEIKDATADLERWHDEFNRSFNDVGGLGVRPKPDYDIKAMREKYLVADAYLKAEAESNKENYELSAIGKKALEKIINKPDSYEKAIEEMNEEIKAFTEKHMFD